MKRIANLLVAAAFTATTPVLADDAVQPVAALDLTVASVVTPAVAPAIVAAPAAPLGAAIPTAVLDSASVGKNAADATEYSEYLIVAAVVAVTGYGYIAFAPEH